MNGHKIGSLTGSGRKRAAAGTHVTARGRFSIEVLAEEALAREGGKAREIACCQVNAILLNLHDRAPP